MKTAALAALAAALWLAAPACAAGANTGDSHSAEEGDAVVADTARVFPSVTGRSLEGREYRLPGGFEGRANLVLIAFRREHQALVDTWMPAAARLEASYPDFRYYELPTIGRGYSLFRSFIDGGMRAGIPDSGARARTITLYIDKTDFRAALGLASEETVYALVVDERGLVVHSTDGGWTAEKGEAVAHAVNGALAAGEAGGGDGGF